MNTRPFSSSAVLWMILVLAGSMLFSCDRGANKEKKAPLKPFPTPKRVQAGADGLVRLNGQTEPYTGPVILSDEALHLRYFAYYHQGKLHGPEIRYYEDGTMRKLFDFEHGEKVRHREWFPNAQAKTDAMMVDGVAYGPHRTWFEDGRPRWTGTFVEDLLWQGRIVDYSEDGKLMWDAIFDKGRYLSGTYPEAEQENLIANGLLKPENAVYPRKPSSPEGPPPVKPAP